MVSKSALILGAGLAAGAAVVGYCVYSSYKRKKDLYSVSNKSLLDDEEIEPLPFIEPGEQKISQLPSLEDAEQMQAYFLQEVQTGEQLLSIGDYFYGIEHLANAVAVCTAPDELLAILKDSLTPELFNALLHKLPLSRERLVQEVKAQFEQKSKNMSVALN